MVTGKIFDGFTEIEIISADIPGTLAALNNMGVRLYDVCQVDALTVRITVHHNQYSIIQEVAVHRGTTLTVKKQKGFYWNLKKYSHRKLLIFGLLLVVAFACWMPSRVLFVEVEGNTSIPDKKILEQAELCGISFGSARRDVRSEKMKNELLAAIPELQWAGINTMGCTAVISVKERTQTETDGSQTGVSSIVAVRDGIVESCTSTKGNLLCKAGQAVKTGEVLISGYTDCGISIKATQAEGEVFAQTSHEISVIMPLNYEQKGDLVHTEKKYSLLIGKKRINFYKDSGISDAVCDKMYSEYYLTLPGGFQLPFAVGVLQLNTYDPTTTSVSADDAQAVAGDFAERYLLSQMISGRILSRLASARQQDELYVLRGHYICSEMIGRVQTEEILDNHGKDN